MEPVKPDFYKIAVEGEPEPILINKDLIPYFITLDLMVNETIFIKEEIIRLPDFIKKRELQWCIDAYVLFHTYGPREIRTIYDLYGYQLIYEKLIRLQTPTPPSNLMLLDKSREKAPRFTLPFLFDLVMTLNFLEGRQMLIIIMDTIYRDINRLPTTSLIEQVPESLKRKRTEGELPLLLHYRRQQFIHDILIQFLPEDLLTNSSQMPKYINPIQCGANHQLFLASDGSLYGSGDNRKYQLGLKTPIFIDGLAKIKVAENVEPLLITAHANHSLCLTTDNRLFSCGEQEAGELALGHAEEVESLWQEVSLPDYAKGEILLVKTGEARTMILTTMGLFACGDHMFGQLGIGGSAYDKGQIGKILAIPTLTPIFDIEGSVIDIQMGRRHTLLWTTSGLYECGYSGYKQQNPPTQAEIPALISTTFKPILNIPGAILSIACGYAYSAIVTTNGLYVVGQNENGQLGLGDFNTRSDFVKVENLEAIPLAVYCGPYYTIIKTESGLYATGSNVYGILGIGDVAIDSVNTFTKMIDLGGEDIQSITPCSRRLFIITTKGIYQTGLNAGIPTVLNYLLTSETIFARFTKLKLDLGYTLSKTQKERRIGCHFCSNLARYKSKDESNSFICSRYCLYKTKYQ